MHIYQNKNKWTFSSSEREIFSNPPQKKPSTETLAFNPCNFTYRSFPWFFSDLGFRVKKSCLSFVLCIICYYTNNPHSTFPSLVVRISHPIIRGENLHHKLVLSLRSESKHSYFSPTKSILKKSLQWAMALKKQPTTGEGITYKGKFFVTVGAIISSSDLNLNPIVEETVLHLHRGQPEISTRH